MSDDIVSRLREMEDRQREYAHDYDGRPKDTQNWYDAETCAAAIVELERLHARLREATRDADKYYAMAIILYYGGHCPDTVTVGELQQCAEKIQAIIDAARAGEKRSE